jgi:hypothetical protein
LKTRVDGVAQLIDSRSMASPDDVRVLSIRQPWAWAISTGRKKVENRTWATKYQGPIYIHASLQRDTDGWEDLKREHRINVPEDLPRGAIVAVARLVKVVDAKSGRRFGKWFQGPKGWVLADVRPLKKPVPAVGMLGLWRPSAELRRAVARQTPRT